MAHILVIEDDQLLSSLIAQRLSDAGHEVEAAYTGEQAIESVGKNPPDLVLLDILLPGKNGYEILHELKANESTSKVPVIVLSNLGQKEDIDKAMSEGADDYMVKVNFTPKEILEKVRQFLGKKESGI